MADANTILNALVEEAFAKIDRMERKLMEIHQPNYRYLLRYVRDFGFRQDRWAVFFVCFSPKYDQELIVTPINWLKVVRGRFLMVCVPSFDFCVPEAPVLQLPAINWQFFPVMFCPEGSVHYPTLALALAKRAKL
jgi:hypothetical protein